MKKCCFCKKSIWPWQASNRKAKFLAPTHTKCRKSLADKMWEAARQSEHIDYNDLSSWWAAPELLENEH